MWQFTASLNWSVSRDGAQRSQESGPILCALPPPPQPISTHCIPPGHLTNTKDISSYHQISIHYRGSVSHSWMPPSLISPLRTQCQSLAAQYVQCVIVVALCIPPPPSPPSLTKRLTRGSLKLPALVHGSCPRPSRSLAIFQDLSPVTSYTCKYNGLGDYWAINKNTGKVGKGV